MKIATAFDTVRRVCEKYRKDVEKPNLISDDSDINVNQWVEFLEHEIINELTKAEASESAQLGL